MNRKGSCDARLLYPLHENRDGKCWLSSQIFQSLNLKIGVPILVTPKYQKVALNK
jgi:hypothetical protein